MSTYVVVNNGGGIAPGSSSGGQDFLTPTSSSVATTTSSSSSSSVSSVVQSQGNNNSPIFIQDCFRAGYERIDEIGKGAYGTVYKARDRDTGEIVALKKMRFSLTEDGVPMAILREISLLKQLQRFKHPNIVRLLDITHGQRLEREMSLNLIFEHVHQDLASYIEKCPPPGLALETIKNMTWQIINGVDFLHSHRIVHRDLKPQNLLVTRSGTVKLTDFGLARIYDFCTLLTSVVVTLWYRSPEVLMGLPYATPVDMWACGCIMAELYLRRPIFSGQYEMDQLNRIFDIVGLPSQNEWPEKAAVLRSNFKQSQPRDLSEVIPELDEEGKDLLNNLLCFSPEKRLSAAAAMRHVYFEGTLSNERA